MSDGRYKIIRHIETVRNYLDAMIREIMVRAETHDQSKLAPPEIEVIVKFTPLQRDSVYGSPSYHNTKVEMKTALEHHYKMNRHHPEHFLNGIRGMNLIDLLEMLCDWKTSAMGHREGDFQSSLEYNQKRFGYGDELMEVLANTVKMVEKLTVDHHADQS